MCCCIFDEGKCLDGCKIIEICFIWCEVGYLFGFYGFVIFICGEIQFLIFVILGIKLDEKIVDDVLD